MQAWWLKNHEESEVAQVLLFTHTLSDSRTGQKIGSSVTGPGAELDHRQVLNVCFFLGKCAIVPAILPEMYKRNL